MAAVVNEALDEYVARVLDADPTVKRLTMDIRRLQRKLHHETDDRAWRTYMQLESLVNHRQGELLRRVAERLTGVRMR